AFQVGVSGEAHAKQVEHFTLIEVCRRPNGGDRLDGCAGSVKADFQTHTLLMGNRKQMVDHPKARLRWIPIHAGEVGQIIKWTSGKIAQNGADFTDGLPGSPDRKLVAIELDRLHNGSIPLHQTP